VKTVRTRGDVSASLGCGIRRDQRGDGGFGFRRAPERQQAERSILLDCAAIGGPDLVEHGERLVIARRRVQLARSAERIGRSIALGECRSGEATREQHVTNGALDHASPA
jgi:hypothetical protein